MGSPESVDWGRAQRCRGRVSLGESRAEGAARWWVARDVVAGEARLLVGCSRGWRQGGAVGGGQSARESPRGGVAG